MSKIFEYTNDGSLNRSARIRRLISNSGYARQERGIPTFYSMEVNLPLLTKAKLLTGFPPLEKPTVLVNIPFSCISA